MLNADDTLDGRVGVVVFEREVLVLELEDVLHLWVDAHSWQLARLAAELQMHLVEVVEVDVRVASRVDEIAWLEAADLCHHHTEQGVGGDIERYAKEAVGTALVELQREFSIGNIELEEGVAGRQVHVLQVGDVPSRDDDTAAVWVALDGIDSLLYLVDEAAVVVGPRAPLVAVDVSKVARLRVGPFVPDAHTPFL